MGNSQKKKTPLRPVSIAYPQSKRVSRATQSFTHNGHTSWSAARSSSAAHQNPPPPTAESREASVKERIRSVRAEMEGNLPDFIQDDNS